MNNTKKWNRGGGQSSLLTGELLKGGALVW